MLKVNEMADSRVKPANGAENRPNEEASTSPLETGKASIFQKSEREPPQGEGGNPAALPHQSNHSKRALHA